MPIFVGAPGLRMHHSVGQHWALGSFTFFCLALVSVKVHPSCGPRSASGDSFGGQDTENLAMPI